MSQKLTIVVTCTDRKSVRVPDDRRLRSVADGNVRISAWIERLESAGAYTPLRTLYQGDAWAQLPRLERAAREAGFDPTSYVASAGLGLRPLSATAPSYGATFTPNHADSVPGTVVEQRAWWDELNIWNGSDGSLPDDGATLFVLSRRYADVLAPLVADTALSNDVLVIGGSDAIAPRLRLSSDAKLRSALGGTLGALNMRTAVAWMERLTEPSIASHNHRDAWHNWATGASKHENYDRTPLSDEDVISKIQRIRTHQPSISRSRALRDLRDSGYACEQKRFARLFEDARGGAS